MGENQRQIYTMKQGSESWEEIRLGKVTASCFGKALAGGQGKTRRAYMIKLIAERMTGQHQDGYTNSAMQNGTDTEAEAREYYELLFDCQVRQVGFIELNENIGCSPDGLIGDNGMWEAKCPLPSTHIETILADKVPSVYVPQVQGQLWVSEREWCDFTSYNPFVKVKPYWGERVYRDEKYIADLEKKINAFVDDMLKMIDKLTSSPF